MGGAGLQNAQGMLGGLASGLGQLAQQNQAAQGFGRGIIEQQMHAMQQQMDIETERARLELDARRLAQMPMFMTTDRTISIREDAPVKMCSNETFTWEPDIDKLPIREYLQRRVDAWLAPVAA